MPFALLFAALSTGRDHLLLDSGTWFSLERPEFDQLRALIEEAQQLVDHDGPPSDWRPEHAGLWDELVELGVVAEQSRPGGSRSARCSTSTAAGRGSARTARHPASLPADRLRWLSFLWRTRLGGILADEMGLGKTLQALALAQAALRGRRAGRPDARRGADVGAGHVGVEAARFAPELRVVAITETPTRRGSELAEAVAGAHIVLTSYTLLRLEAPEYEALEWSAVLLDEAQFVKNHASKAYKAVRRLRSRSRWRSPAPRWRTT